MSLETSRTKRKWVMKSSRERAEISWKRLFGENEDQQIEDVRDAQVTAVSKIVKVESRASTIRQVIDFCTNGPISGSGLLTAILFDISASLTAFQGFNKRPLVCTDPRSWREAGGAGATTGNIAKDA